MSQPLDLAPATCPTCDPWVRWWRTGSGNYARQIGHEQHCEVRPRIQRAAHAAERR